MITAKRIFFINQSPNTLLNDIAVNYDNAGWECKLVCGKNSYSNHGALNRFASITFLQSYDRSSALFRFITWLGFSIQCFFILLFQLRKTDHVFLVSNPPFLIYLLFPVLAVKKVKTNYLIYDLYPDILKSMYQTNTARVLSSLMKQANKVSFKYVDHIFVPSESLKAAVQKYTEQKISVVYNWVDTLKFKPIRKEENIFLAENKLANKFIVLYSGNLGKTHDVETILDAADQLKNNTDIIFLFIGEGEGMQKVKTTIQSGLSNVIYKNRQDNEWFAYSIASGDLALISYKEGFENYSIPSKLPYYLATGTPVVFIGKSISELSSIISQNDCGYTVANNHPDNLVTIVLSTIIGGQTKQQENARHLAERDFSLSNAKLFLTDDVH